MNLGTATPNATKDAWTVREALFGTCSGCASYSLLPPFGQGLCFLCATDGPPGEYSPAIGAEHEDVDARRRVLWPTDAQIEMRAEIEELFADAQRRTASLCLDYAVAANGFCFSSRPNPPTRARWTRQRPRPEHEAIRMAAAQDRIEARRLREEARVAAVQERIRKRRELGDLRRAFYQVTFAGHPTKAPFVSGILFSGAEFGSDRFLLDTKKMGYTAVSRVLVKQWPPYKRRAPQSESEGTQP